MYVLVETVFGAENAMIVCHEDGTIQQFNTEAEAQEFADLELQRAVVVYCGEPHPATELECLPRKPDPEPPWLDKINSHDLPHTAMSKMLHPEYHEDV